MMYIIKLAIILGLIDKKAIDTLINGGSIAVDNDGNIKYHHDDFDYPSLDPIEFHEDAYLSPSKKDENPTEIDSFY